MSPEDFRTIVEHFRQEGRVIKSAPVAFLVSLGLLGLVIWFITERHYTQETADLRAGQARLEATIKSLEATIKYQDSRIAELSGQPRSNPGPTGISRLQLVNSVMLVPQNPLTINVYFQNTGNVAAYNFIHTHGAGVAEKEVDDKALDEIFVATKATMKDAESREVQSEIQPNETVWFTADFLNISQDVFDKIKTEKKLIYVLLIGEYKDTTTPPGKWRVTEVCLFITHEQSFHRCNSHNRIFLSD